MAKVKRMTVGQKIDKDLRGRNDEPDLVLISRIDKAVLKAAADGFNAGAKAQHDVVMGKLIQKCEAIHKLNEKYPGAVKAVAMTKSWLDS